MSRYESALLAGLSACIMSLLVNGLTFGTSVMIPATTNSNVPSGSFHHSRSAPLLRHHQFKACASLGRCYCDMRLSKPAITLPAYSDMRNSSILKTLNAALIMVLVPLILALCTCLHEPSECRRKDDSLLVFLPWSSHHGMAFQTFYQYNRVVTFIKRLHSHI